MCDYVNVYVVSVCVIGESQGIGVVIWGGVVYTTPRRSNGHCYTDALCSGRIGGICSYRIM